MSDWWNYCRGCGQEAMVSVRGYCGTVCEYEDILTAYADKEEDHVEEEVPVLPQGDSCERV